MPQAPARVVLVVSERGPGGARLVSLDEHGDRQFALVARSDEPVVRDTNPALSPDGKWLAFVSSRGRGGLARTALWLAPVGVEQGARRIAGDGDWIDAQPTWTRDGRAIVFASTRARGNFDLWSYELASGALAQLTTDAAHEVTPSCARDGSIYFGAVSLDGVARIARRRRDGTIEPVTDGPADTSPALAPDERTLAFARAVEHASGRDADLFVLALGVAGEAAAPRGEPQRLVDLPLTDEGGPVWSPDGRYVFATSALRGEAGATLFASVIAIDRRAPHAVARVLEDRAGAIARLTPAVAANAALDGAALRANPEYVSELSNIVAAAIARQRAANAAPAAPK